MSNNANSFDVFISYKNSDANGERTRDAQMAFDLHDKLEERNISAFCSTLSLTRMGQGAYKDAINNALDAAKVLVVVGTSIDNILSPWVKYEWGSFHDDLLTGRKSGGTLVSLTSGLNPNELPRELRGYESFLTEQNGEALIVDFIAAALESKIEMGYAGTKLERKLGVIGPATRSMLVNAEDPDPQNGTPVKKETRGKGGLIAAACVLAVACVGTGIGIAVANHNEQVAAQEEQARIEAEQEAARQAELERQQQQQEEQEKLSSYTVRYLVKGSSKELKDELEQDGATIGTTVKITAPTFKNYTLKGSKTVKLTIAKDASANVVTFYYAKKKSKDATPSGNVDNDNTSGGTNSGNTSGGSGSGTNSGGGGGSKGSGDEPIIDNF